MNCSLGVFTSLDSSTSNWESDGVHLGMKRRPIEIASGPDSFLTLFWQ